MVNSTVAGLGGLLGIIVIAAIAVTIWYLTLPDKEEDPAKEDSGDDDNGDDNGDDGGSSSPPAPEAPDAPPETPPSSESSTPPETKDPGQQNGSDDATLTSGPCVYGGTSDGKFDDGFHCRLGSKKDAVCPKDVPEKCWNYSDYKYYTMPGDTEAKPGKCPLGGDFDQKNCYVGPYESTACPPGVKQCFKYGAGKYYKPIDPA